jgi:hypothetical protein
MIKTLKNQCTSQTVLVIRKGLPDQHSLIWHKRDESYKLRRNLTLRISGSYEYGNLNGQRKKPKQTL